MNLERLLVIAPHPDDDVIAASGLMQRAAALHVLYVTDGENNPWPQRWMHKKWTITREERARWGAMRREEATRSLALLGVAPTTTFLGRPDQKIADEMRGGDDRLVTAISAVIEHFKPTWIASPSGRDLHRDHRTIAWATHLATRDIPITTYLVHGSAPQSCIALRLELTETEQKRKRAAIECHSSQLLLSRDRFLSHARPTEIFHRAEHDWISAAVTERRPLASVRRAIQIVAGLYPSQPSAGKEPAADIQDRPGDVPGLL